MNKDDKIKMLELFDAKHPLLSQKSLLEAFGCDFAVFPKPVEITLQFVGGKEVVESHTMALERDQPQEGTTTPPADPFTAEDKFEAPMGIAVFKCQTAQEIVDEWCLKIQPWFKIGIGVLDNRRLYPKFIKETARQNRFKRLHFVKRKIDERN